MTDGRLIVACDFGTTAFRALVVEVLPSGQSRILTGSVHPCEGFQDGDFVDIKSGSMAIARTIRGLQDEANVDIRGFTFNVSGSHLRSVIATGQIPLGQGGREITERDVAEVVTMARSLKIPFDHRILTVNPIEFSVDRVSGVREPRGRVGSRLEVKASLVTGSSSVIRNIENVIDKAGFEPVGHAVDVLAAGTCLLDDAEREQGVLFVDIGGTVTHWAVMIDGCVQAIGSTPWGGDHLTLDLASGLRIEPEAAEAVKCDRGVVLRSLVDEIDINVLFDQDDPEETPGLVAAVLEPRMEEIFSEVKDALGPELPLSRLAAGVIVTGGGSRCRGTRELAEEVFGLPVVTRYLPTDLLDADRLPPGQWATALGLVEWTAGTGPAAADESDAEGGDRGGLWSRVRGLFRGKQAG